MTAHARVALSDVVTSRGGNNAYIKGKQSMVPSPELVQGFSASGPDVWVKEADYSGPGVVLSAVGARCGKTFLADGNWTAIANTHALIPGPELHAKYLWYLTNREDFWVKGGSAQPFVKVKETLSRMITLPPLDVQKRIVAKLDDLVHAVDDYRSIIQKQSSLQEDLYRSTMRRFAVTRFSSQARLGEVCSISSGSTPPKHDKRFWGGKLAWVTAKDLKQDVVMSTQLSLSDHVLEVRSAPLAASGDVLILVRGMGLANGFPSAVAGVPCSFNQDLKCLHPIASMNSMFLLWSIRQALSELNGARTKAAHGTLKIETSVLLDLKIPTPPIAVQNQVAETAREELNALADLTHLAEEKVQSVGALQASVVGRLLGQAE